MSDILNGVTGEVPADPAQIERDLKAASNIKHKNDKLSWSRRQTKVEEMVEAMRPIEDKIMEYTAQRQEILDKVQEVRKQMVKECIHPRNSLVHKGTHIVCKFCNAKLSIPRQK